LRYSVARPVRPGRRPYGDWARRRDISGAGALLVRPDGFVAFRHFSAAPDAENRSRTRCGACSGMPEHAIMEEADIDDEEPG
jgi:hypothetical protein